MRNLPLQRSGGSGGGVRLGVGEHSSHCTIGTPQVYSQANTSAHLFHATVIATGDDNNRETLEYYGSTRTGTAVSPFLPGRTDVNPSIIIAKGICRWFCMTVGLECYVNSRWRQVILSTWQHFSG